MQLDHAQNTEFMLGYIKNMKSLTGKVYNFLKYFRQKGSSAIASTSQD